MLQAVKRFAEYNQELGLYFTEVLEKLDEEVLRKELKTDARTLLGLVDHIITGNRFLMGMMKDRTKGKYFPQGEIPSPAGGEAAFATVKEIILRQNQQFLDFANAVAMDLAGDGEHGLPAGVSDLVPQFVLHSAYHWGQLSQILSEMDIEHDGATRVWMMMALGTMPGY